MDDGGCTFSFLGLFSAEFTDKQPLQQLKGNKLIIFGGGTFVGWLWAMPSFLQRLSYLLQRLG